MSEMGVGNGDGTGYRVAYAHKNSSLNVRRLSAMHAVLKTDILQ